MKLTKRDKVLVYILVLVIIFVGGIKVLILPMAEGYSKSKSIAEEAIMQADNIDMAVVTVDSEKIILKNSQDNFSEKTKDYLEYMSAKDLTNYMNSFIVGHGLSTNSFSTTDTTRTMGEDSGSLIYSSTITLELAGTYGNLRSFINSAYENKALLVTYFSIISDNEKLEATDTATMEIEIQLYMYDMRWSE